MAKWKSMALITTLVMPMAIAAGTSTVSASKDAPESTTIKIHKQNRDDVTVTTLPDSEGYFYKTNEGELVDGQHYFWGDGTVQNEDTQVGGSTKSSNNPFDWYRSQYTANQPGQASTGDFVSDAEKVGDRYAWTDYWNPMNNVTFDAINVPDDVLQETEDGGYKISNEIAFTQDGVDVKWSDFLNAKEYPVNVDEDGKETDEDTGRHIPKHDFNTKDGMDRYGMTHTKNYSASTWSIDYKDVTDGQLKLTSDQVRQALLAEAKEKGWATKTETTVAGKTDATDGVATFSDLPNGNWLFMEEISPEMAGTLASSATPMFVATPVLQPTQSEDQDNGDKTWYDNTEDQAMHIYAKNYTVKGDLTIKKTDSESGAELAGVKFAAMQLNEVAVASVNEAIANGLLSQSTADIEKTLKQLMKDAGLDTGSKEFYQSGQTGKKGTVKFDGLTLGKDYYVLEIGAPEGYQINGTLKQIHITALNEQGDGNTDAGDGTANAQGDTLTVQNYDDISLDKDINVLEPVSVDDFTVKGFEDDGETPIYGNASNDETYVDTDTLYGVSRGKAFSYTINAELNKNIGSYSEFNLVDDIPYQVSLNSWTMYAQVNGELIELLQAVDTQGNVNDHATDDGIANQSVAYDSDQVDPDSQDDRLGVSFKFANKAFAESVGYEGSIDKTPEALRAQTEFIADNLLHMHGQSGSYNFDDKFRTVESGADGQMNLDFKSKLLQGLQQFIAEDESGKTSLVFKMNGQTNSAAQADENINNTATLNYNPSATTPAPAALTDSAATHAVGWDIQKVDENGEPLAGAGFDLGRQVTAQNLDNVLSQLIGQKNEQGQYVNNGNVMSDDTLAKLGQKIGATGERADQIAAAKTFLDNQANDLKLAVEHASDSQPVYVWFTHLEAASDITGTAHGNLQPIFDVMDSDMQMGDIYWTTNEALATTHQTTTDGYLQYCGVADGHYILKESIVPGGYQKMNDQTFTLASTADSYYGANGAGADLTRYPMLNGVGTDNKITGTNEDGTMPDDSYVKIENQRVKKSIFPITGGVGILGALAAGIATMGSAIANHRRRG